MATTSVSSNKKKYIAGSLFLGGVVTVCVLMVLNWEIIVRFQKFGYLGLFIVTLVSGFSIPVPVPYMVFTFTLGGVLQPALVGATAGTGLGIGGTLLYLTGRGGRRIFPQFNISDPADEAYSSRFSRFLRRIKLPRIMNFAHRRGALGVFLMSVLPNPLFAPMAISLGTMRFRFAKFFFACWAGQTAKAMGIAYLGYLGLGSFLRWFGAA
jgi:membrane protein YqaA with SNARE-associated domain